MVYQVVVTPKAQADLDGITEYIARNNSTAAANFGLQLIERAHSLAPHPQIGTEVRNRPGIRHVVHYPYSILYRIDDLAGEVQILRFWHGAQNPKKLRLE